MLSGDIEDFASSCESRRVNIHVGLSGFARYHIGNEEFIYAPGRRSKWIGTEKVGTPIARLGLFMTTGLDLRARKFKFSIRNPLTARVTSSTAMGLKRGIVPMTRLQLNARGVSQRHTLRLAKHSAIEPEDRNMVAA